MSLRRITKIIRVTARYRLDLLIDWRQLPWPLRLGFVLSPVRLLPAPKLSRGERLRRTLEDLGPIFIKFGQALSTRRDLLPPDVAVELARLQDKVPPFDGAVAAGIVEEALGEPIDRLFTAFDKTPLASASIAQVHTATLPSGREVVVKVLRPDIRAVINQDLALLFTVARFVHRFVPDGRRLRPMEVAGDYRQTVLDELDLQREAANTAQLRRNFENSDLLYVPEVFFDYSRRNVLTLERIDGIPISDIDAIRAQGTDMKLLAERGVEIFFTQLFRDNFFHADMHPGNIFVSREHPERPQYIGIDCAIIGSLSDFDRYYLARNLVAIFHREYREVARLHVECGWVPANTRIQDFEAAIRSTCEPIFQKPLGEISFGQVLVYLFQVARRFNMEIQPSLVLLQKTLLNIEGLGRELYPQLDLWSTAQPYIEQWLRERYAPSGLFAQIRRHAPQWLEQLPHLPDLVLDNLQGSTELRSLLDRQQQQLDELRESTRSERHRQRRQNVAAVLAVAGVALGWPPVTASLAALPPVSWVLLALAALLWLRR